MGLTYTYYYENGNFLRDFEMGQEAAANDNVFNPAPALESTASAFEATFSPLQSAAFNPPATSAEMSDAFNAVNPTRSCAANDAGEGVRGFMVAALDIHGEGLKAEQFDKGGALQMTCLATELNADRSRSHSAMARMQADNSFFEKVHAA